MLNIDKYREELLCSVTIGRSTLLKIPCSYSKCFSSINSGTNMQTSTQKLVKEHSSLSANVIASCSSLLPCPIIRRIRVQYAHQSAASPASQACMLPRRQWHGILLWLAHKTSGCGQCSLTADILLNHPRTHSWTML